MSNIQIDYDPFPKQEVFHDSPKKFKALITGIGFGKTKAMVNEFLRTAMQHPKSLHVLLAPTSKIMRNATLPEFRQAARPLITHQIKSENTFYLLGGAQVIWLTADNDRHVERLRGLTIGSFGADEAALFPLSFWKILLGRLRSAHGPLKGSLATTPKGYNWVYWYFVKKRDPVTKKPLENASDYEWFGGSSLDNPHTPEEYKRTILATYSGAFKEQEIYGKFVGFEGQVYKAFRPDIHIKKEHEIPKTFVDYAMGLDVGFTNPMASVIVGIDSDRRAWILEEFYEKGITLDTASEWIRDAFKRYPGISNIYVDPSEPQFIMQLQNSGINAMEADNAVQPGINFVQAMFEPAADGKPRIFISEKCEHLIDEINTYRYKETADDKPKQDNPLKVNDHLCDAMRYVLKTHLGTAQTFTILTDKDGTVF